MPALCQALMWVLGRGGDACGSVCSGGSSGVLGCSLLSLRRFSHEKMGKGVTNGRNSMSEDRDRRSKDEAKGGILTLS